MNPQAHIRNVARTVRRQLRGLTDPASTVFGLLEAAERSLAVLSQKIPLAGFHPLEQMPDLSSKRKNEHLEGDRREGWSSAAPGPTGLEAVKDHFRGPVSAADPVKSGDGNILAGGDNPPRSSDLTFTISRLQQKGSPVVNENIHLKKSEQPSPIPLRKITGIPATADGGKVLDDRGLSSTTDGKRHPGTASDGRLKSRRYSMSTCRIVDRLKNTVTPEESLIADIRQLMEGDAGGAEEAAKPAEMYPRQSVPSAAAGIEAVAALIREYEQVSMRENATAIDPREIVERRNLSPGMSEFDPNEWNSLGGNEQPERRISTYDQTSTQAPQQTMAPPIDSSVHSFVESRGEHPHRTAPGFTLMSMEAPMNRTFAHIPVSEKPGVRERFMGSPRSNELSSDDLDTLCEKIGEILARQARMHGVEP